MGLSSVVDVCGQYIEKVKGQKAVILVIALVDNVCRMFIFFQSILVVHIPVYEGVQCKIIELK